MRKIETIEELREKLLDILKDIKIVCEENNIRYCLSGGSLIGAIRHKGFIPWDDDIDVYMPRPDYEKFIELYPTLGRGYKLLTKDLDDGYSSSYAKLMNPNTLIYEKNEKVVTHVGVFVDIFPLDGLGNSIEEAKNIMKKIKMPINLYASYRVDFIRKHVSLKKNILAMGAIIIAKLFYGKKKLGDMVDKIAMTYNFNESKYVGEFVDETGDRRIYNAEWYEKMIPMQFEDIEVNVPCGYHEILTKFYGDYMTLPPEEQRVLKHGIDAYVLDDNEIENITLKKIRKMRKSL